MAPSRTAIHRLHTYVEPLYCGHKAKKSRRITFLEPFAALWITPTTFWSKRPLMSCGFTADMEIINEALHWMTTKSSACRCPRQIVYCYWTFRVMNYQGYNIRALRQEPITYSSSPPNLWEGSSHATCAGVGWVWTCFYFQMKKMTPKFTPGVSDLKYWKA